MVSEGRLQIHSFIQPMCARHHSRHWKLSSEQSLEVGSSYGAIILGVEGKQHSSEPTTNPQISK